ncbi:hypothetical protein [Chitinolyticbacter albus]|uniref:hypothetical protein n=1 Tax=Chitinolyticbacter albus TaxID=2961951 RepID=UPI0021092E76|nr:hypothetical protein [Chitinolyticbacter albus]
MATIHFFSHAVQKIFSFKIRGLAAKAIKAGSKFGTRGACALSPLLLNATRDLSYAVDLAATGEPDAQTRSFIDKHLH